MTTKELSELTGLPENILKMSLKELIEKYGGKK